MNIQNGQFNAVKKIAPEITKQDCNVICETGSDDGVKFNGTFLVKISKRYFRFDDMKLTKSI
jgi:hypothetical protein